MDVLALRAQNPSAPVHCKSHYQLTLSQYSPFSPLVECMNEYPLSITLHLPLCLLHRPRTFTPHQTPYPLINALYVHLFLINGLILYLMFLFTYGLRYPLWDT